jgi:hypothetical protein
MNKQTQTNKKETKQVNKHTALVAIYKENYKPLKKEIQEDYRGGKTSHAHGLVEST